MARLPAAARAVPFALGLVLLQPAAAEQNAVPAVSLPARDFGAVDIRTSTAQRATGGWVSRLPAHVVVPDAQQRFVVSPVGGVVTAVLVAAGETVEEGQPLAELTSPELLALQRELAQARAERERTRQALRRDERLFAEGLIPASRIEGSRAEDRQAAALLREKQGLLELAGGEPIRAGELTVTASMPGVVLTRSITAGERIEPATVLFRIARLEPLDLEIELPIAAAARIEPGNAVRVPETDARGTVVTMGRSVSDAQTVSVRARLDSGTGRLSPGQHVEADIATNDDAGKGELWTVPAGAVVRLGKAGTGAAVFVLRGDAYDAVPVEEVAEAGDRTVVRGGLAEGDAVVSRGASQLKAAAAGIGADE